MEFKTYLIEKKIDPEAFRNKEPDKWQSFKALFELVHPNSFTVQKKFLLNDLRRLYHLKPAEIVKPAEVREEAASTEVKKPARAVVRRAPVVKKTDDSLPDT